ncbi:MAG: hypothetical protein ACOZQL_19915 [Myxococcota bacterium]
MPPPALSLSVNEGRLVEIRGRGLLPLAEFTSFRTSFTDTLIRLGRRVAIVADLRGLSVQDPQVYEGLYRLMKMDSPLVDRFSYLLEPGSLLAVNVARVIQQAGNPVRKICSTPTEAADWLSGVLDAREKERLAKFLEG